MAGLLTKTMPLRLWSKFLLSRSSCSSVSSYLSTSTSQCTERKWMWPLDYNAQMMAEGHIHGTRFAPVICVMNSARPLHEDLVQEALIHLWRKMPNMRVAVGERNGSWWYYEAEDMLFDFKELEEGADVMRVIEKLNSQGFPAEEETSLRVRMSRAPADAPCPIPELQHNFPHQHNFIFQPNHSIFDGSSFPFVMQTLMDILDGLMQGQKINDDEQIGKFVDYEEINQIDTMTTESLRNDPKLLESLKNELLSCNQEPLLLKAFPPPGGDNPKTKCIIRYINKELFDRIHALCKDNGVSFNAAFMASINTAIVDLLKEAGMTDEEFTISVTNATNLRRYMAPKPYPIYGLFVRSTSQLVRTKENVRQHFWEYARQIYKDLHHLVKSRTAMQQEIVRRLALPSVPPQSFYLTKPPVIREYGLTNIGDITPGVPGNGKMVQITGITLLTVVHNFTYMCLHQIFTHRLNTSYTFSYATDYLTEDTANILVDKVLSILQELGA